MAKRLFGTDGIRGRAGDYPLDSGTVRLIGAALARTLAATASRPVVLIGRDTRESGPEIEAALADGVRSQGVSVISAGVLPTPAVAHCVRSSGLTAGAVVSASHNPYQDNGIKIFGGAGYKLSDSDEAHIEELVLGDARELADRPGSQAPQPSLDPAAVRESYLRHVLERLPGSRPLAGLTIVLDCGNGAASELGPEAFRRAGANVLSLFDAPDGRNINAGCGALHPERLAEEVLRRGADLGAAFDGDADRAIFIDEQGTRRDGDDVLAVLAPRLKALGELSGKQVVGTVMTNIGLAQLLESRGIGLVRTAVGDKYVLEEMLKGDAPLGGEPSGHIIFLRHATTGDGILTALVLAGVLAGTRQPLSELTAGFLRAPQLICNVRVGRRADLSQVPEWVKALDCVEGALAHRGRVVVRFSGTEPLLRIMLEGPDREEIEAHARALEAVAISALCS